MHDLYTSEKSADPGLSFRRLCVYLYSLLHSEPRKSCIGYKVLRLGRSGSFKVTEIGTNHSCSVRTKRIIRLGENTRILMYFILYGTTMVPIESPYAISYWSSTVTMCLSFIISEIFIGRKSAFFAAVLPTIASSEALARRCHWDESWPRNMESEVRTA